MLGNKCINTVKYGSITKKVYFQPNKFIFNHFLFFKLLTLLTNYFYNFMSTVSLLQLRDMSGLVE